MPFIIRTVQDLKKLYSPTCAHIGLYAATLRKNLQYNVFPMPRKAILHEQHLTTAHSTMPYEAILTMRFLRFTRNTPHYNAHSLMPHIEIPHKQYLTTKCPESEFRCLTGRSLRCDPYNPTPHAQYLTTQCPQSDVHNPMPHKAILTMQYAQYLTLQCPESDASQGNTS